MSAEDFLVSRVLMPEKGLFLVRVDDILAASGRVRPGTTGRFIVALDYGEDVGRVIETAQYDPAVHGDRIPGFRMVRPLEAADGKIIAENEKLAAAMRNTFISAAREVAPNIRIPVARLSFGRTKLFLRYSVENQKAEGQKIDFTAAQAFLKRQFGVEVGIWAMGPRDEVSEIGAMGPCGRVCCCHCWQRRFPTHLAPERHDSLPSLMNGTCGRFKCCLAFERD